MNDNKRISIRSDLIAYLEVFIIPEYDLNEKGHGREHVSYVIKRCQILAFRVGCNVEMCVTAAAYHDIMHHVDKDKHEILGAKRLYEDKNLRKFFNEEQMIIMKEAVEDHRASLKREPRSIYGKVLSTADRSTDYRDVFRRSYYYHRKHQNQLGFYDTMNEVRKHIEDKFGPNGYAKTYIYDPEFERMKEIFAELLKDKKKFAKEYLESIGIHNY